MWGWLSSIIDGIASIVESLSSLAVNIATSIIDGISGILSSIVDGITSIIDGILNLPMLIIDGLKTIFVPDIEHIKNSFETTVNNISEKIGLSNISGDGVKDGFANVSEQSVESVSGYYSFYGLGTLHLKFMDATYLKKGIDYFRPILRGFIILLLFFYNYKQLLSFIGQDAGILGRIISDESKKGGDKE